MKEEEIIRKLTHAGLRIDVKRNGNDTGWRIDCATGTVVNVYDTGTMTIQGKNQEVVKHALGGAIMKLVNQTQGAVRRVRLKRKPSANGTDQKQRFDQLTADTNAAWRKASEIYLKCGHILFETKRLLELGSYKDAGRPDDLPTLCAWLTKLHQSCDEVVQQWQEHEDPPRESEPTAVKLGFAGLPLDQKKRR
jgi:hypothetical protein